jgi:methylated-DNA-[protein]-cysteine S-methyltransferase
MQQDDIAVGGVAAPVGRVTVAVTRAGLADVSWGSDDEMAARVAARGGVAVVAGPERVGPVLTQLAEYFSGTRREFGIPVDWRFYSRGQRAVLETLYTTVPYGASVTYGELAARSGTGVPARGIGAIMGSNPIPIVVPCHRVLAADGLGGYSGGNGDDGLAVKRWLLTLEGVLPPTLDWAL